MEDIRSELLDVVRDVRTHLEYQTALGISSIETLPGGMVVAPQRLTPVAANQEREPLSKLESSATMSQGLDCVRQEIGNCTRCKLHRGRKNIVFGEGDPSAVLVFIGEGPGHEEDEQGRPFVGAAGQLLTDIIVKGMKLKREDVYICNIVKCRPPNNRNPEPDEIEACEPFLIKQLQTIKPKIIVALGSIAAKTLLKSSEGITALRGKWQTYQGIPLMPTFHPAYLLRNPNDKALVWKDIQLVMAEIEKIRKEA